MIESKSGRYAGTTAFNYRKNRMVISLVVDTKTIEVNKHVVFNVSDNVIITFSVTAEDTPDAKMKALSSALLWKTINNFYPRNNEGKEN